MRTRIQFALGHTVKRLSLSVGGIVTTAISSIGFIVLFFSTGTESVRAELWLRVAFGLIPGAIIIFTLFVYYLGKASSTNTLAEVVHPKFGYEDHMEITKTVGRKVGLGVRAIWTALQPALTDLEEPLLTSRKAFRWRALRLRVQVWLIGIRIGEIERYSQLHYDGVIAIVKAHGRRQYTQQDLEDGMEIIDARIGQNFQRHYTESLIRTGAIMQRLVVMEERLIQSASSALEEGHTA